MPICKALSYYYCPFSYFFFFFADNKFKFSFSRDIFFFILCGSSNFVPKFDIFPFFFTQHKKGTETEAAKIQFFFCFYLLTVPTRCTFSKLIGMSVLCLIKDEKKIVKMAYFVFRILLYVVRRYVLFH